MGKTISKYIIRLLFLAVYIGILVSVYKMFSNAALGDLSGLAGLVPEELLSAPQADLLTLEDVEKASEDFTSALEEVRDSRDEEQLSDEVKQAINDAEAYANSMHLSKLATFYMLVEEDYVSEDDAEIAVNKASVNWQENADYRAKSYRANTSMSKVEIFNALISREEDGDMFTEEQASSAISKLN